MFAYLGLAVWEKGRQRKRQALSSRQKGLEEGEPNFLYRTRDAFHAPWATELESCQTIASQMGVAAVPQDFTYWTLTFKFHVLQNTILPSPPPPAPPATAIQKHKNYPQRAGLGLFTVVCRYLLWTFLV